MQKSHVSKAQLKGAHSEEQAGGRQAEERGLHVGTNEITPGRAVRGRREPGDEPGDTETGWGCRETGLRQGKAPGEAVRKLLQISEVSNRSSCEWFNRSSSAQFMHPPALQ